MVSAVAATGSAAASRNFGVCRPTRVAGPPRGKHACRYQALSHWPPGARKLYDPPMDWLSRHRRLVVAAICAICAGAIIAVHFFPSFPFISAIWRQEQNYEDFLQREGRKTATRPDFVFLGIDQSTLELPPLLPEEVADNRALQLMTERPFPVVARSLGALARPAFRRRRAAGHVRRAFQQNR